MAKLLNKATIFDFIAGNLFMAVLFINAFIAEVYTVQTNLEAVL